MPSISPRNVAALGQQAVEAPAGDFVRGTREEVLDLLLQPFRELLRDDALRTRLEERRRRVAGADQDRELLGTVRRKRGVRARTQIIKET